MGPDKELSAVLNAASSHTRLFVRNFFVRTWQLFVYSDIEGTLVLGLPVLW